MRVTEDHFPLGTALSYFTVQLFKQNSLANSTQIHIEQIF